MSTFQISVLVVGLLLILVIYFWEHIKDWKFQSRKTVRQAMPDRAHSEQAYITENDEVDREYLDILSELNQSLAAARTDEGPRGVRPDVSMSADEAADKQIKKGGRTPSTNDLFENLGSADTVHIRRGSQDETRHPGIIALHVTARESRSFNGHDILDAANSLGLEFGEMDIFHHFGVGDMQGSKPLFSVVDMYEPGSFDLNNMDQRSTRGLTLFFCLPVPDAELVFELLLNTAQRMSEILQGDLRTADRTLVDDRYIDEVRKMLKDEMER